MMQTTVAAQVVSVGVSLVGVVVALVLLITRTRGRARVTGTFGTALLLLGMLTGLAYRWVLGPILGQVPEATMITILAWQTVIGSVLTGAGLALLTCAIIVAGWPQEK